MAPVPVPQRRWPDRVTLLMTALRPRWTDRGGGPTVLAEGRLPFLLAPRA